MKEYKIMYKAPGFEAMPVRLAQIDAGPYASKHIAEIYCKGLNDSRAWRHPNGEYIVVETEA